MFLVYAVGTLPHASDLRSRRLGVQICSPLRILRCMPLIKAPCHTVAACACGLMLLTTPALAGVPDGVPVRAFDEPWKGDPDNPLNAEKYWGLFNVDRTPKQAMK